jgi:hypothetical protein
LTTAGHPTRHAWRHCGADLDAVRIGAIVRKLILISVVALVLAATVAVLAQAANGPRLNGSFRMTATILSNDIGIPPGSVTTDVYVFKSTCRKGACAKVGLTRGSGGRDVKSTLRRTAPGVYKGNEGPEPYVCVNPIGTKGEFTGEHKITVTKSRKGRATKVSGKTVIHITGCTETIEEVKLRGKLTQ